MGHKPRGGGENPHAIAPGPPSQAGRGALHCPPGGADGVPLLHPSSGLTERGRAGGSRHRTVRRARGTQPCWGPGAPASPAVAPGCPGGAGGGAEACGWFIAVVWRPRLFS